MVVVHVPGHRVGAVVRQLRVELNWPPKNGRHEVCYF